MNATRQNKSRKAKAQTPSHALRPVAFCQDVYGCIDCRETWHLTGFIPLRCPNAEPPSEIVIEKYNGYWSIAIGSHHVPIERNTWFRKHIDPADLNGWFPDHTDPMIVSKALKAKANGPVNIVWNL